jgi:immunoglobulin-binding protein 1
MAEDEPQSLRECYSAAEAQRKSLENAFDSTDATFQENLASAIAKYKQCLKISDEVSIFSPNETLEDVSSSDLQYANTLLRAERTRTTS